MDIFGDFARYIVVFLASYGAGSLVRDCSSLWTRE